MIGNTVHGQSRSAFGNSVAADRILPSWKPSALVKFRIRHNPANEASPKTAVWRLTGVYGHKTEMCTYERLRPRSVGGKHGRARVQSDCDVFLRVDNTSDYHLLL